MTRVADNGPLRYRDIHWGTHPTRVDDLRSVGAAPASSLGDLKAISYVTVKAGDPGIWRHEFARLGEPARYPRLLRAGAGPHRTAAPPPETKAVGLAIDVELEDGVRVILADCQVVTDDEGRAVFLAWGDDVPVQIEVRPEGPVVTPHGIER